MSTTNDNPQDDLRHCNYCHLDLPPTSYTSSALKGGHYRCSKCATAKARVASKLRKGDVARNMLHRLRRKCHKQGFSRNETREFDLEMMGRLVSRFGSRSMFSGKDGKGLTLAQWDKGKPLSLQNVILCNFSECREHRRRGLADYHPLFVEHVNKLLRVGTVSDPVVDDYPPLADKQVVGFSADVAAWHFSHWGCMHPAIGQLARVRTQSSFARAPRTIR
jgi:hypothetical protein